MSSEHPHCRLRRQSQRILIFGGTGSLGTTLTRCLLALGTGHVIGIFSRDEAKNFYHKQKFQQRSPIHYFIGDVRNYSSVIDTIVAFRPDVIIHAAAMKQVPLCEEFPAEAVATNVLGTENIMRAASALSRMPKLVDKVDDQPLRVLSISTDKAVKPVNAYGCTKQLQERITLRANEPGGLIANCVRYGNVLESTGSVIPVFNKQIAEGKKLTITDPRMTRFLLSLEEAVNLIYVALTDLKGGRIFIPKLRSAYISEVAEVMLREAGLSPDENSVEYTGIRPGEKLHEILVSEEEMERVNDRGDCYIIDPFHHPAALSWGEHYFASNSVSHLLDDQADGLTNFLREKGVITCVSESQAQAVS